MLDNMQRIDPKTVRYDVTIAIRQAILRGDILNGEQLNQVQIADKLGVSRGPVREALRQLEEEGLVQNVPYKGTFVIQITPAYIEELYSLRRNLERYAIRRAIESAQPEDLEKLRETVVRLREAVRASDLDRSVELDLHFHYLIYESAHHNLLLQIWKSLEAGIRLCLAHGHRNPHDIVGTHPDILAAIEAKDVNSATALLDDHIRVAGEAIYRSWSA